MPTAALALLIQGQVILAVLWAVNNGRLMAHGPMVNVSWSVQVQSGVPSTIAAEPGKREPPLRRYKRVSLNCQLAFGLLCLVPWQSVKAVQTHKRHVPTLKSKIFFLKN